MDPASGNALPRAPRRRTHAPFTSTTRSALPTIGGLKTSDYTRWHIILANRVYDHRSSTLPGSRTQNPLIKNQVLCQLS